MMPPRSLHLSVLAAPSLLALCLSTLGCVATAPQSAAPAAAPSAPPAAPAELAEPVPPAPAPAAPSALASGLPDTPVGRQLGGWLEAFGSQEKAALLAFHERHFPYSAASRDVGDIEREHRLSVGTGGFEVRRVEQSDDTRLVVLLKERNSPQHARVELQVATEPPHAVTHFQIGPVPTPSELRSAEERAARSMDAAKRRAAIESVGQQLRAHYVDAETAQRVASTLQEKLARGEYDSLADAVQFADTVWRDLMRLARDKHMGLHFGPMPSPPDLNGKAPPGVARNNHGFGVSQRLSGNVALLVINGFPPPFDEQKVAIGERMSELTDADAVIVDLRNNRGGFPPTEALVASYFFDDAPLLLKSIYRRDENSTRDIWTEPLLAGKRFGSRKPVYILTGRRTFSGGEALAYGLQAHGRAVVVGEGTGGGAHPSWPYPVQGGFVLRVPFARSIHPLTGTNWEGIGVVPDVDAPEEQALETAHRLALRKLGRD